MKDLGYYNGVCDRIDRMTMPIGDRACYFGDGLFEVVYTRNHKMYAADEHMRRMYESAAFLGIDIPLTQEEFLALLDDLVHRVDEDEQIVYWQISRGTGLRTHAPSEGMKANILVTIRPMKLHDCYRPMKLVTVEDTRFFHCNMKTLNLLPTVLASRRAQAAGAQEAVFHRAGHVTECAHSNLAIIRDDGCLQTAPADNLILAGITRGHVLTTCQKLGIPTLEKPFTLEEMMGAAQVVVISSGTLFCPASYVDGIPVGGRRYDVLDAVRKSLIADFLEKTE